MILIESQTMNPRDCRDKIINSSYGPVVHFSFFSGEGGVGAYLLFLPTGWALIRDGHLFKMERLIELLWCQSKFIQK